MDAETRDLVRRLGDATGWKEARERLMACGAEAVPDLLEALGEALDPMARAEVLRMLSALGDPRAADAFRAALVSEEPTHRAIAARGLQAVAADDAVLALLAALDHAPDPLHADSTPAVEALAKMGPGVLPEVLRVLESGEPHLRRRAQTVLERVTYGLVEGRLQAPPLSRAAQDEWLRVWEANGYRWDASAGERRAAVQRWRDWLAAGGG
jgi:HEAT repeat protein